MRRYFLVFLAAPLWLTNPLWGQQQALSLNLADACKLAVQRNPEFAAARFNSEAAYQVPLELHSALEPTFTGNVTGVGADSGSRLAAGGLNNPVVYSRLAAGLTVSQLVTDFRRTKHLIDSARSRAGAQDEVTESTRAEILVTTARAYFGVLRAKAVLTVAEQTVAARQLVSDQVTALAQNNLRSGLDVSFANVNLADAQLLLSQARNGVKSAEAELAAALGLPDQSSFSLSEEPMRDVLPDQLEPLIQQAFQNRPELKQLRLQQIAANQFVQAEHGLQYPTVAVVGTAGLVPAGEANIPGRYGAIGVNVSIPVFNGGIFKSRQTEAELKAKAAAENTNSLANRITRDVRVAYFNAKTAYERVGLTEQLLKQAQLALDLARGRYDLGLSSIVELSQAQLGLTSSQISGASARFEYQTLRTILDYEVGSIR